VELRNDPSVPRIARAWCAEGRTQGVRAGGECVDGKARVQQKSVQTNGNGVEGNELARACQRNGAVKEVRSAGVEPRSVSGKGSVA